LRIAPYRSHQAVGLWSQAGSSWLLLALFVYFAAGNGIFIFPTTIK